VATQIIGDAPQRAGRTEISNHAQIRFFDCRPRSRTRTLHVQSLRQKGRTPGTIAKYRQLVRALDRWMVKKGYRQNPAVTGESPFLRRSKPAQRVRRLAPEKRDGRGQVIAKSEEDRLQGSANPWQPDCGGAGDRRSVG
jgi:hypothetical protein